MISVYLAVYNMDEVILIVGLLGSVFSLFISSITRLQDNTAVEFFYQQAKRMIYKVSLLVSWYLIYHI